MYKVISILPETTMFLVENETEILELLNNFNPNQADIFLSGNTVQLHIKGEKSIQIIAENTDKYRWAREETK